MCRPRRAICYLEDQSVILIPLRKLEYHLLTIYDRFEIPGGRTGIFLKSSRFNHACHPYATCTYAFNNETNRLVTSAIQDIEAGQEITISYCGYGDPSSLPENYGFYCDCPKCPSPEEAAARAKFFSGGR
jgi:hypothetical protein